MPSARSIPKPVFARPSSVASSTLIECIHLFAWTAGVCRHGGGDRRRGRYAGPLHRLPKALGQFDATAAGAIFRS
jgi:hypothetical protein